MLCRRCMVVMRSGTSYEQRKGNSKGYRRFDECPKCHDKVFNNTLNFQETLARETEKRRNR